MQAPSTQRSIDQAIEQAPETMRAVVEALQALRGVAKVTAVTLAVEVGTFERDEIEVCFRKDDHPSGHDAASATATKPLNEFRSDFVPRTCGTGVAPVLSESLPDLGTVRIGTRNVLLALADALSERTHELNLLAHGEVLESRRDR